MGRSCFTTRRTETEGGGGGEGQLPGQPADSHGGRQGVGFEAGQPHAVFEFRSGNAAPTNAPYTVTADGKRFLLNTLVDESGGAPLTVVVNWEAGLKR
jgi:hypothetical protein